MKLVEIAKHLDRVIGDAMTYATLTGLSAAFLFALVRLFCQIKRDAGSPLVAIWGLIALAAVIIFFFISTMHTFGKRRREAKDTLRQAMAEVQASGEKLDKMRDRLERSGGDRMNPPPR